MPILKQLVSGTYQAKRRSRTDLTREMISAPLGDFRHTMHVGRSGDAFGDTSFLSSHSGEASPETVSFPRSPRPSLLSRTFRSSKRSQSVTRVDQQRENTLLTPCGSPPTMVKNAMSLPFLGDNDQSDTLLVKSLSSTPVKHQAALDNSPAAIAAAMAATHFLELEEKSFGELHELPDTSQYCGGGGMKHAESVMSFHVDLGPSMLGEILGVMEKEDDDLGYEEGKNSEGRASPPFVAHSEAKNGVRRGQDEDEEQVVEEEGAAVPLQTSMHLSSAVDPGPENGAPYTPEDTPEAQPKHPKHLDSCSVSSSSSAATEEKPNNHAYAGETDSATFSGLPEEESHFSSFMEDEDDEIHV